MGQRRELNEEERQIRERVTAYLRRAYEKFRSTSDDTAQRAFAERIGVDESTVSHALKTQGYKSGMTILAGLVREHYGDPADMLFRDPDPRYFEALKEDGRKRRHESQPAQGARRERIPETLAPEELAKAKGSAVALLQVRHKKSSKPARSGG